MLKVNNKSNNKRIEIICSQLNTVFDTVDFWKDVLRHKENFYLGNINGLLLHNLFNESKTVVDIYSFKSKNPFTSSNGYTTEEKPNSVFLNSRKFNRSDASIAATIAHEVIHSLDNTTEPQFFFGHGDNYDRPEKDACAPQWFSDLAYKHLTGGLISEVLPQKDKYIV